MPRQAPVRIFKSHLRATTFISDFGGFMGRRVINKTGSDIAVDKLVAISGYDVTSKLPKVVLADADSVGLATDVFVTIKAITNGAKGLVQKGAVSAANLNTNFGTVGDPVYLDVTAGAFTGTAPTAYNARQLIVGFTMVKSATVGQIRWDIKAPSILSASDIQLNMPTVITGTISSADITGTSAGQFGHAQGYPLVATPGANKALILLGVSLSYKFSVAAYTGGGNVTVNWSAGGAAFTGLVSAANSIAAASDKPLAFYPLTTAADVIVPNVGLNLVAASAFTQPGTAAGIINYAVAYFVGSGY